MDMDLIGGPGDRNSSSVRTGSLAHHGSKTVKSWRPTRFCAASCIAFSSSNGTCQTARFNRWARSAVQNTITIPAQPQRREHEVRRCSYRFRNNNLLFAHVGGERLVVLGSVALDISTAHLPQGMNTSIGSTGSMHSCVFTTKP